MLHCHVVMRYLEPGVSGLLAGLAMLARRGRIRLTQEMRDIPPSDPRLPWHLRDKGESAVELIVDGRIRAFFDVHDSWEIDASEYATADHYFKRSYDPARYPPSEWPRLRPLGLVNEVRMDGLDLREGWRIVAQRTSVRHRVLTLARFLLHTIESLRDEGPRPNLGSMHAPPSPDLEPRVLFMAGVWDPSRIPQDAPEKAAEFTAVNAMRAECVRRLRAAFGERFYGGIQHSEFARSYCPDVLLPDERAASKRAYIRRVKSFPICVATTGLHGSNGWKLAEYVGLSRAIVTEPLRYGIPGDFGAERNYLEFSSPAQCVEQVGRLMDSPGLRAAQMEANWRYYNHWLRPDVLAGYVVATVAGETDARPL
jgi:hypothetical protein